MERNLIDAENGNTKYSIEASKLGEALSIVQHLFAFVTDAANQYFSGHHERNET